MARRRVEPESLRLPIDDASRMWNIAQDMRGRHTHLAALLLAAQEAGISPTWRTIAQLGEFTMESKTPSEAVVSFLGALVGAEPDARVLDPWAENGLILAGVAETSGSTSIRGIINGPGKEAVASYLLPSAQLTVEDPLFALDDLNGQSTFFDLIVSAPPWGTSHTSSSSDAELGSRVAKLTLDQRLVLASCQLLAENGRAFFLLPNSFLLRTDAGIRSLLRERGLHIWSIIALPASWMGQTSLVGNVIEIRRAPTDLVLVAKASADSANESLIANHSSRSRGKVPEVGTLVELQEFSTWEAYENGLAFEAAAKAFGAPVIPLSEIVLDKVLGDRTPTGGFEDRPNSVFMPALGTTAAVTSRSELTIKPHNYIQLVLNPAIANAEYVANYLNTQLGFLTRGSVYTGAIIQRASMKTIGQAPVVLPSLEEQMHVVGLQRRITELRAELDATQRDLWRSKKGARIADRALQAFPSYDALETWLPRLPFPLASILWNYQATLDSRRKVEILFAFFEATSEFLTTILLSGLRSNAAIYEELKVGPLSEIEGDRWREASLGFWVTTGMNLAKTVRRMLSEERPLCLDLFRCSAVSLDALASKDLLTVLQRVGGRRNEWKGHGGIESDRETVLRLDSLQSELTSIFTPLTLAFEDLVLIRPKSMQYDGQVYEVVAEELTGPVVPFRESTRQVVRPLKSGGLILLERGGRDGLELLPFIRMRAGAPADTACYFYSRLGTDGARFVSYHQAQDSEVVEHDVAIAELVNDLMGTTV